MDTVDIVFELYTAPPPLSVSIGQMRMRNRHRRKSIVTNLRYADDTTIIAGTKEDHIELTESVRQTSEKAGQYHYPDVLTTKVMTIGDVGEVTVDGKSWRF